MIFVKFSLSSGCQIHSSFLSLQASQPSCKEAGDLSPAPSYCALHSMISVLRFHQSGAHSFFSQASSSSFMNGPIFSRTWAW